MADTEKTGITIRGMAPLLQVYDMPASIHFYRDILGFEVVNPTGSDDVDWVLLRLQGVELMLNTRYEKPDRPVAPDPVRVAVHEDTAIYFGCPDVQAAYTYLLARGAPVKEPVITGYGFRALYVTDPDGFDLVFHWPLDNEK